MPRGSYSTPLWIRAWVYGLVNLPHASKYYIKFVDNNSENFAS